MEKRKVKTVVILALGLLMMLRATCSTDKKYCKVFLSGGASITAELAVTDEERQRGLMFRDTINWDQGMLFIFEEESMPAFWMMNVKFPIDILWLDREKKIVHIEKEVPPCKKEPCPTYSPRYPALYVLELKAGSVEKHGLKLFERIDFILPKLR